MPVIITYCYNIYKIFYIFYIEIYQIYWYNSYMRIMFKSHKIL